MTAERTEQRVVVADDDVLLREGLAGLLERAGFAIAGQAGDAAELLRVVRDEQPNLAIIDIRMPPGQETEGLDAARVIRRERPDVAILVQRGREVPELMAEGARCRLTGPGGRMLAWPRHWACTRSGSRAGSERPPSLRSRPCSPSAQPATPC